FRGLTCHSNHQEVIQKAVECEYYDEVTIGYNVFDIERPNQDVKTYDDYLKASGTRDLIRLAKAQDLGIIAMKTLKIGGRQQNLEQYKTGTTSIQQAMLKWVLDNKNISAVITEILTYDQLEEDLAVARNSLSSEEKKNLYRFVAERSQDYCHMCGNCRKACPSQIETVSIQRYLTYHESYRKTERARDSYSRLNPEQTILACRDCGKCEKACPYGVSVRKRLSEAHTYLNG
ncbi:MAG: 4Fe-4S dicluster domain-containing protein, partial [Candidatus Aminicenantes bacterium]